MAHFSLFMVISLTYVLYTCSTKTFDTNTNILQNDNVIFQKINSVSMARSQWIFTFVLDLKPYENFIAKLRVKLQDTDKVLQLLSNKFSNKRRYELAFKRLKIEISELKTILSRLVFSFGNYKMINTKQKSRQKRTLIPFAGKILSWAFGTLTNADLKVLKSSLRTLAAQQQNILHVVKDSVSILNITRVEVSQNRRAVNQVIQFTEQINMAVFNVTNEVNMLKQFVGLYTHVKLLIDETKQSIYRASLYLNNLQHKFNDLALGHLSPSVIGTSDLKKILTEISKLLPNRFVLPSNPDLDIWFYYKTLTCTLVEGDKNQFLVIVSLPLLDTHYTFDLFKIFNIPIAYHNTSMTATYDLNSNYFAINNDRTHFIVLDDEDAEKCSLHLQKFCAPRSPMYAIVNYKPCLIQLFLQKKEKSCHSLIKPHDHLPKAMYITQGTWMISLSRQSSINIVCQDHSNVLKTMKPPLHMLHLDDSCYAVNDDLVLTSFFIHESNIAINDPYKILLTNYNVSMSMNIWKPLTDNSQLPKISIPEKLSNVPEIPMNDLISHLNDNENILMSPKEKSVWNWKDILIFLTLFLCLLVIVFMVRQRVYSLLCKTKFENSDHEQTRKSTRQKTDETSHIRQSSGMKTDKETDFELKTESHLSSTATRMQTTQNDELVDDAKSVLQQHFRMHQ